ncbi:neurofilament heavy polypeptide-like [Mizuhopecten yessoensis]|uniref:Transcription elongation factor spt5 n=1 Tax=Mizuhopecten yessoensis TaxID=6573 RepID=A0A210PJB6_MIZYE|nr:neurofilament heavy polypeptide-like [Mizuhopecten yessoensis]OWF36506.1 Transcription elongation factor spt5 [Mizuhopecten yessoensis]
MPGRQTKTPKRTTRQTPAIPGSPTDNGILKPLSPKTPGWLSGRHAVFKTPGSPSPKQLRTRRSSMYQSKMIEKRFESQSKVTKVVSADKQRIRSPPVAKRTRRSSVYQKTALRLVDIPLSPESHSSKLVSPKGVTTRTRRSSVYHKGGAKLVQITEETAATQKGRTLPVSVRPVANLKPRDKYIPEVTVKQELKPPRPAPKSAKSSPQKRKIQDPVKSPKAKRFKVSSPTIPAVMVKQTTEKASSPQSKRKAAAKTPAKSKTKKTPVRSLTAKTPSKSTRSYRNSPLVREVSPVDKSTPVSKTQGKKIKNPATKSPVKTQAPVTQKKAKSPAVKSPVVQNKAKSPAAKSPVVQSKAKSPAAKTPVVNSKAKMPAAKSPVVQSKAKTPAAQTPVVNSKAKMPAAKSPVVQSKAKTPAAQTPVAQSKAKTPATKTPVVQSKAKTPATKTPVVQSKAKTPATNTPVGHSKFKTPAAKTPVVQSKAKTPATKSPVAHSKSKTRTTKTPVVQSKAKTPATKSVLKSPARKIKKSSPVKDTPVLKLHKQVVMLEQNKHHATAEKRKLSAEGDDIRSPQASKKLKSAVESLHGQTTVKRKSVIFQSPPGSGKRLKTPKRLPKTPIVKRKTTPARHAEVLSQKEDIDPVNKGHKEDPFNITLTDEANTSITSQTSNGLNLTYSHSSRCIIL